MPSFKTVKKKTDAFADWTREELISEIEKLYAEKENFQILKNEHQRKISEGYQTPIKNERGAGRKPKITPGITETVRGYRAEGMTYREIAEKTGLSLGLVHKAANG